MVDYEVVVDENTNYIYNEEKDKILVRNKNADECMYVEFKINDDNTITIFPTGASQDQENNTGDSQYQENNIQKNWTRSEIIELIYQYKENEHFMNGSTMKKIKIWGIIAKNLGNRTADQCANQFKYLKRRYIKKKENMGTYSTGKGAIKFEYFDDFEVLFGEKPNVTPKYIASSLKGAENVMNKSFSNFEKEENDEAVDDVVPLKTDHEKKIKRRKMTTGMSMVQIMMQREESAERRHKENMATKEKALSLLRDILNKSH